MRAGPLNRSRGAGSKIGCVLDIDFRKVGHGDGDSFMSRDVYGHLCAVAGGSWQPNGRLFDGVDDWLTIPDTPALDMDVSDYTLLAYIKTSHEARQVLFIKSTNNGGLTSDPYWYFEVYHSGASGNNGKLHERRHDGTTVSSEYGNTVVYNDKWHLVGISVDRNVGASFSVDGAPDGGGADSSGQLTLANNGDLYIGNEKAVSSYDFKGLMGECWIYNRAEYAARILQRAIRNSRN